MTKNCYIDNEKFFNELVEYKRKCKEAEEKGEEPPGLNNYIGECFIKIGKNYSNLNCFIGYSYKDEMISDAIENCVSVARNFDENFGRNPFSYFTRVMFYAFIRRIKKEKSHQEIKYKLIEDMDLASIVDPDDEEMMRYLTENVRKQVDKDEKVNYDTKKIKKEKSLLFDD